MLGCPNLWACPQLLSSSCRAACRAQAYRASSSKAQQGNGRKRLIPHTGSPCSPILKPPKTLQRPSGCRVSLLPCPPPMSLGVCLCSQRSNPRPEPPSAALAGIRGKRLQSRKRMLADTIPPHLGGGLMHSDGTGSPGTSNRHARVPCLGCR